MNIVAKVVQTIKRAMRGQSSNKPNKPNEPNKPAIVQRSTANVHEQQRTILWTFNTGYCRVLEVA